MNHATIRAAARISLQGKWTIMAIISIVYGIVNYAAALFAPFNLIIEFPLSYGFTICGLHIARSKDINVGTLFAGFKIFVQTFLAGLLMFIFTMLWSLLLIIPGIMATYSYRMTYYILADNPDISAMDAITKSKQMMKGNKAELFLLDLSFIGWYILGAIPLGIGLLWVVPYHLTATAHFYNRLK